MTFNPSHAFLPARTLPHVPWMEIPGVRAVVWALGRENVRFIGGCVRDLLAGRPNLDVDIATVHTPQESFQRLKEARVRVKPIGIEHGTVVAITSSGRFEVTSLRRDVETDGRHARVEFTNNWAEDAARRDFTINAMSVSPNGELFDPAGGIDDLQNGHVRFIGDPDRRLKEDVLRLLRFFRFSAWYGRGAPDTEGIAACARAAERLKILSGERISGEMRRLLAAPNPYPVTVVMAEHRMLRAITAIEMDTRALGRLVALEQANDLEPKPVCRLAALLPADKAAYEKLAERLRFSNEERYRLVNLARPLPALGEDPLSIRRALYRAKDREIYTLQTLLAAAERDPGDMRLRLHEAAAWAWPKLPVSGLDIIEIGIRPGPHVGEWLKRLEEWWILHDFQPDREACLSAVRNAYNRST